MSRVFNVTVHPAGGALVGITQAFADSIAAVIAGIDLLGAREGAVKVRPQIERTYMEGYSRWPDQLHDSAFMDAWRGWSDAALERSQGIERPDGMTAAMHRRQS